jgi:hypothetical protein
MTGFLHSTMFARTKGRRGQQIITMSLHRIARRLVAAKTLRGPACSIAESHSSIRLALSRCTRACRSRICVSVSAHKPDESLQPLRRKPCVKPAQPMGLPQATCVVPVLPCYYYDYSSVNYDQSLNAEITSTNGNCHDQRRRNSGPNNTSRLYTETNCRFCGDVPRASRLGYTRGRLKNNDTVL